MTNKEAIEYLEDFKIIDDWSMVYMPCLHDAIDLAIKALEDRPAGRWVEHTDRANNRYGCNICGSLVNIKSSFCPWCGAKMGGDRE